MILFFLWFVGNFLVIIISIFKDKYNVILVKRFFKGVLVVLIEGLLLGVLILESVFEWCLVSEVELVVFELLEGVIVS